MLLVSIIFVSGCIGGGNKQIQPQKETGQGLEIVDFSSSVSDVYSGKLVSIQMMVENKGDYKINKDYGLVYLITGSDWALTQDANKSYTKDLKPADPVSGAPPGSAIFRWSAKAPILPASQKRTDTFIARAYYDYQTKSLGNVWLYPEVEATAARDKKETLPSSEFSCTKAPISLDVSVVPDPVIVAESGELFSLVIDIKNNGNGVVYKNGTITPYNHELTENDLNKISLQIELPNDIIITDPSCYQDVELIGGEANIICDLEVIDMPTTKKTIPITVKADYGYYTDKTLNIKILGK